MADTATTTHRKKTGINIFDNLNDEEYRTAKENARANWQSLSREERVERLAKFHEIAREKIKQHGGMITHKQAVQEYYNDDYIKLMQELASKLEQNGYLDAARGIRLNSRGVISAVIDMPHLKALIASLDLEIEEMEK